MNILSISEVYALVSFIGAIIAIIAATIAPWLAERSRFKGSLKLRQTELLFSAMTSSYQELFIACDTLLQSDTPENRHRVSTCVSKTTLFASAKTQDAVNNYVRLIHTYIELNRTPIPSDNMLDSLDSAKAVMISSMQRDIEKSIRKKRQ